VGKPLTGVAAALTRLPREVLVDAVLEFDKIAQRSAARVVGNGGTMRIHGRRGKRYPAKMATKARTSGTGASMTVFIAGVPKGPWVWIESGTKPHDIGRKGRYLKAPGADHPVMGPIVHPGTRGQQAWTRAVLEFRRDFPDIAVKKLREAVNGK
jgi:hypothetical protein